MSNVGAARAAGVEALLTSQDPSTLWLATTDADSTVPQHWLTGQLEHAAQGFDAVVGTISMDSTDQHYPDRVLAQARAEYTRAAAVAGQSGAGSSDPKSNTHRHVHGANLGMHADAYLAAGGFPPVVEHEDVVLVAALTRTGCRLAWVDDIAVTTSTRRDGRTPAGFAGYLRDLEQGIVSAPADATRLLA